MRVVGIDPGRDTGLVALDVATSQIQEATWLTDAVMRPSASVRYSDPERDFNFAQRIQAWLEVVKPDLVVLEEPLNAAEHWNSQRGNRPQARGTSFRLGAYYAAAVTAAGIAAPTARLVSYPPTKHAKRPGWMRGRKRVAVLCDAAMVARVLKAPKAVYDVHPTSHGYANEHLLMALGVLMYHWTTHRDPLAVTEAVA